MTTIQIFETDFGRVLLPQDFPIGAYRKNGKPDRRNKHFGKLIEFEASLREAARQEYEAGRDVHGRKLISWSEWLSK